MPSRTKPRGHIPQKGQIPQPKNQENKGKALLQRLKILSPTGKFAASVALILAIVETYYAFSPKISITPTELIDTLNPYSTPFIIKNESLLPLRSIEPVWKFREIISKNGKPIYFNGPYVRTVSPAIPSLESGESTSIFLPELYKPIKEAKSLNHLDIEVVVLYRPYLLPYKRSKELRFVTIKGAGNTFRWITKAISE
jgi:hypothetical protein